MAKMTNVFTTDKFSPNFVNINNCAVVHLADSDHINIREKGRSDYLLMYITKGKLYAKVNGKEYTVNQNEAFLYHPNEPQEYRFYKKDSTINYWVHFNGVEMDKIIASLGLNDMHHLKLNNDTFDIEQLFSRLCREFNSKEEFYKQICSGLIIVILSSISRGVLNRKTNNNTNNFVEHILGEFHSEPAKSFVIEDLAEEHSVTVNYLIKAFKKATGVTPAQYIIGIRIKKAKELLLYSDYSLVTISELLGYQNPSYFSRLFKKHVGISPTKFRNRATDYKTKKDSV